MIRPHLLQLQFIGAATFAAALALSGTAGAQTIVDQWNTAVAPSPPPLKAAALDAKTTALLILDVFKQTCLPRPRCVATIPHIQALLTAARAKGVLVIYTGNPVAKVPGDVVPELAPLGTEPTVTTIGDKFFNTNLDAILKAKGIKTIVLVGTSSNNAVMYTASFGGMLGYNVIVPVDGMSSASAYIDQYVTVQLSSVLLSSVPGGPEPVTLTRSDMITF
jgi:nicotinamidase-related amidase